MSDYIKKIKLKIYLIKENIDIGFNNNDIKVKPLENDMIFYYKNSNKTTPQWINFFDKNKELTKELKNKIFNSTSKALLIVPIKTDDNQEKKFALSFGYGYTILKPKHYEPRFGLKFVLNHMPSMSIKNLKKRDMYKQILSSQQSGKPLLFHDFGINITQDLINGITVKSTNNDEDLKGNINGADSLIIACKRDISTINNLLKKCFEIYNSDNYKEKYGFIDHLKQIKDEDQIIKLDEKLIEQIKNNKYNPDNTTIWMEIPEIIEWENISEFKFQQNSFDQDLDLKKYLEFKIKNNCNINIDILKKDVIKLISSTSETTPKKWNVYQCLYCEIKNKDSTYILTNGTWFEINKNFNQNIINEFKNFPKSDIQFLEFDLNKDVENQNKKSENRYNERLSKEINCICMDKKLINYAYCDGSQKIEFCDLYTKNKEIIHVKRYQGSQSLSHLWNQGLVSAELFSENEDFRKQLNENLKKHNNINEIKEYLIDNIKDKPNNQDKYKIIFGIIFEKNKEQIPFFSMIAAIHVKKELEKLNYLIYLNKITSTI